MNLEPNSGVVDKKNKDLTPKKKKIDKKEKGLVRKINNSVYISTYILLKIQGGDWKIGSKILSEKFLASKFNCSKSIVHNTLIEFLQAGILESIPRKSWVVKDYTATPNILNLDFVKYPFDFRISISQSWSSKEHVIKRDKKILEDLIENKKINFSKMFHYKKVFYNKREAFCTLKFAINQKYITLWNKELLKNNLNCFLALNGIAIKRRLEKILITPLDEYCDSEFGKFQGCVIRVYSAVIDQNDNLIMVIKKIQHSYENDEYYKYTYTIK